MTFWKVVCLVLLVFDATITSIVAKKKGHFNLKNALLVSFDMACVIVMILYVLGMIR